MYFRDIFIYLHIYVIEYYPAIKKNDILPFVTAWMDLEDITLSEISWTERSKNCMISLTRGIFLKKRTHRKKEQIGGGGELGKLIKGIKRYKLLVIRSITSGDVMYSMVTLVINTVLNI